MNTAFGIGWLDQNRNRAYPMERDAWRLVAPAGSGLDCVLLDALVFDADYRGGSLSLEYVSVAPENTVVALSYAGEGFEVVLDGGEESGPGSYETVSGTIAGSGGVCASISLSFSSHAFIRAALGDGLRELGAPVSPCRVCGLSNGTGVDSVRANGNSGVGEAGSSSGDLYLEDGYRTSPVVSGGKVVVRVGSRFGREPCGQAASYGCGNLLLYFCGQNAVNSGNVDLVGGPGVSVTRGSYSGRPCVVVSAKSELLDLYDPAKELE